MVKQSRSTHDRQRTVLVADDDTGIRSILTYLLQRNGFRVLPAENGSDAVNLFMKHKSEIGIVIIDVRMPVMSGPTALSLIRKLSPDVRVVLTSGMTRNEVMHHFSVDPPWAFLPKPFDFGEVEQLFPRAT